MSGMAVGGESDGDLCRICGGKVSDVVCDMVIVGQHKSVIDVSAKNKKARGVIVREKCQFAEQQNQVGNLPTVVAAHCDSFGLSVNVLSRNKKVAVANEIV